MKDNSKDNDTEQLEQLLKQVTAADGERLTIVRWRDLESLQRWREDPRHRAAQERGRERWYEYYVSEVAEVVRESRFVRPAAPAEAASEGAP